MIFRRSRSKGQPKPAPPPEQPHRPAKSGPSLIGADVVIDGNLQATGELHIDGTVNGDITASVVIVDVHGTVNGHIIAEDVWVRGRVIGPVHGLHVTIVAKAHVEGDIFNQTIAIENGAFIDGSIHRVDDPIGEAGNPAQQYLPGYATEDDHPQDDDFAYDEIDNEYQQRSKAAE